MTRLEQLRQFVADDPSDPVNTYALALECLKHNVDEAGSLLMSLLQNHPDYLPTYYQAATLLAAAGKQPQALAVAEQGMTLAQVKGDLKARRELQALYDEWTFGDD
jgi:DNA-binding SARP family transcriptional activator